MAPRERHNPKRLNRSPPASGTPAEPRRFRSSKTDDAVRALTKRVLQRCGYTVLDAKPGYRWPSTRRGASHADPPPEHGRRDSGDPGLHGGRTDGTGSFSST